MEIHTEREQQLTGSSDCPFTCCFDVHLKRIRYASSWITWFLSTKGNEYFVEIDEEYILDRFNLTGLNGEVVQEYGRALDLITDQLGE